MRTPEQWQRVLGENRQLTVYAVGEPVEAYAVVSHVSGFWTTDHISEIAWSTRQGYESLLAVLGGLAINKTALSWFEPSDGPFYTDYLDQGVTVTVERPIMFRVNDVPAALRGLKPEPAESGEFVIKIVDHLIPGNQGPWHVRFREGAVEVEGTGASADVCIDIRHFAQAFLGEPSLNQLADAGHVEVSSGIGLAAAQRLMPAQPVYCMDFF
jgi:predicted acetyltransferase